jgi:nucleoid-associated protein YgaU
MNLFQDSTALTVSLDAQREEARLKYEMAKSRLERRRKQLLEAKQPHKYTVMGPTVHKDVWGRITQVPPVGVVIGRDAERKFIYQQYLLDFEWHLRCMLTYERLKGQSDSFSHRRPVLTPRSSPEAESRGPVGVDSPTQESGDDPPISSRQKAAIRDLENSIRTARRERSRESVKGVLLDMANVQREGLTDEPTVQDAWSTVGDIMEEQLGKALDELRKNPNRENVGKTLDAMADTQRLGRDTPRAWDDIGDALEDLARKAAQTLRANPTRENVRKTLGAVADAQMGGRDAPDAMEAAGDVAESLAQDDVGDFRRNPTAKEFGKAVQSESDAQSLGRGMNTDLFDVGPHRLKPPGKYKVRAGDWLSKIALEYYGDASRWPPIYLMNQKKIGKNPKILRVGLVLDIP